MGCIQLTLFRGAGNSMSVVILLALFAAAMAAPERGQRIVGGESTTVDRHPYMANMQYHLWGTFWTQWCGGTLISARSVLSAAHCFYGDSPHLWRVRLGTSFASSGGSVLQMARIIIHEQYDLPTPLNYDVAIIHLATPAVLSATVRPIAIAGSNYNLPDGTAVSTTGWGTLTFEGSAPEQLQTVNVNTINQQLCTERYDYLKSQPGNSGRAEVTYNMLCTGILDVGGKDACHGDSGGPVVHDGSVVVGVVSWGFECADPEYPGVNARVSALVNWIVANSI